MRRPCGVRLAAVFFGFVLVLIAPEVKAHGGDASLIHSCVKNGKLRIIDPSDSCKPGETALDWPKTTGSSLVLKDANGTVIGPYDSTYARVFLNSPDGPVVVPVDSTGFGGAAVGFLYTSTDCSGPRLTAAQGGLVRNEVGLLEGTLYYLPVSGTTITINSAENRSLTAALCSAFLGTVFISPNICCFTSSSSGLPFTLSVGTPGTLDISGFVPPFHGELTP